MSIYRPKVRGKRIRTYTAEFVWRGKVHRRNGFETRQIASDWLASERVRLQRGELGLQRPRMTAQILPLISKYIGVLTNDRKCDAMYTYTAEKRLTKLATECGWLTIGDITAQSLRGWFKTAKSRGKRIAAKTLNQYIDIAKQFCDWLRKSEQLIAVNPFADVDRFTVEANKAYRRAATVAELAKLMAVGKYSDFWEFLIYVPLRMKAIHALTWGDLHLDASPPWGTIPIKGKSSGEKFVIRSHVALKLANKRGAKTDKVFDYVPTLKDLREDWKAAGVPFDDGHGRRRLDMHSFRKTAIRLLKASGVSLDQASLVLLHKTSTTTRKYYDDDAVDPLHTDAVERMPVINTMRIAQ